MWPAWPEIHMATETLVQSSATDPAYKLIAEQIIAITSRMREDSQDQETIRVALQAFGQAVLHGQQGTPIAIGPRY